MTMDDGQLMAERDVFQMQRGARLDDTSQRVEQRNDDGHDEPNLFGTACNLNVTRRTKFLVGISRSGTLSLRHLLRREVRHCLIGKVIDANDVIAEAVREEHRLSATIVVLTAGVNPLAKFRAFCTCT